MICRSCGHIYSRKNKQGVCQDCYTGGIKKEKMYRTVKEWAKYHFEVKEKLLEQYDVILTDHMNKRDKFKKLFKRSNKDKRKERREKIKKVIKKIIKGSTSKSGGSKISKLSKSLNDSSTRNMAGLMGKSSHNYDGLISKDKRVPKF